LQVSSGWRALGQLCLSLAVALYSQYACSCDSMRSMAAEGGPCV
jgi:hypothetical protein